MTATDMPNPLPEDDAQRIQSELPQNEAVAAFEEDSDQYDEDDEFYDDDDVEEYEDEFDDIDDGDEDDVDFDEDQARSKKRRLKMHCFSCNRQEGHFLAFRKRWFYSLFVGMTFGLAHIMGPFRCVCCGHSRLMAADFLNLKYWFRPRGSSGRKKSRSRQKR